jgi:phosphate starvation-inducible membrane PsiE
VRLIVPWLLHFVAFGFFKAIIVTLVKSLGHFPVSYVLFINYIVILRPSSPNSLSKPQVHHHLL